MTVKLTFEAETLTLALRKALDNLDELGLLPHEPPPAGDEDDEDKALPFGDYGQPKWAEGATGLIWVKVIVRCWPRVFSNLTPETKLPVFKNPPVKDRQILDPTVPSRDDVLIYNKRFTGDKNSGDTNKWVETAEHGALNIAEIIKADRKRV